MKQFRMVLTGGPGGGKSIALQALQQDLTKEGLRIIAVPEAATEIILSGLSPRGILDNKDFQALQLDLQLQREDLYAKAAQKLKEDVVVLLCDRGALDGKGFIEEEAFAQILQERDLRENQLLARYDAVFHMTSAAKKDTALYSLNNNLARKETPSEAIGEDDRLIEIWSFHPYQVLIPPCETMEEKIQLLKQAVLQFLQNH